MGVTEGGIKFEPNLLSEIGMAVKGITVAAVKRLSSDGRTLPQDPNLKDSGIERIDEVILAPTAPNSQEGRLIVQIISRKQGDQDYCNLYISSLVPDPALGGQLRTSFDFSVPTDVLRMEDNEVGKIITPEVLMPSPAEKAKPLILAINTWQLKAEYN